MVLNDLLEIPELVRDLETYLRVVQSHADMSPAYKIREEIMTRYKLDRPNFNELMFKVFYGEQNKNNKR